MDVKTALELKNLFKDSSISTLAAKHKVIHEAIEDDNPENYFFLEYQPKVSIHEETLGETMGLEALIRWYFNGEVISPYFFIEYFEKSNLIIPVGEKVLEKVCDDMNFWRSSGLSLVPCSINISKEQLYSRTRQLYHSFDFSFANHAREIIHKKGLEEALFEFEYIERETSDPLMYVKKKIMERLFIRKATCTKEEVSDFLDQQIFDQVSFKSILGELKELKNGYPNSFRLSIDDYGGGIHEMSMLRSNVFDTLKVDKNIIDFILQENVGSPQGEKLKPLYDFLHLKSNYHVHLIAEGVESKRQLDILRAITYNGETFDAVQGFYFSKPISAQEIAKVLRQPRYYWDKF